jgi:hypothetical protein
MYMEKKRPSGFTIRPDTVTRRPRRSQSAAASVE